MKKQTFFQLAFVLLTLGYYQISYAQISVGVRGGVSLNNLKVEPLEEGEPEPQSVIGFQVAIPVEIAIGDMFAVQPEIMYGSHGAKQEEQQYRYRGWVCLHRGLQSRIQNQHLGDSITGQAQARQRKTKISRTGWPVLWFWVERTIQGEI